MVVLLSALNESVRKMLKSDLSVGKHFLAAGKILPEKEIDTLCNSKLADLRMRSDGWKMEGAASSMRSSGKLPQRVCHFQRGKSWDRNN